VRCSASTNSRSWCVRALSVMCPSTVCLWGGLGCWWECVVCPFSVFWVFGGGTRERVCMWKEDKCMHACMSMSTFSFHPPTKHPTNQPINQSINQSINDSTNPSTSVPCLGVEGGDLELARAGPELLLAGLLALPRLAHVLLPLFFWLSVWGLFVGMCE
jgi:hypothetical protein